MISFALVELMRQNSARLNHLSDRAVSISDKRPPKRGRTGNEPRS